MQRTTSQLIRLAEIGIAQFFILTIIAMIIYPGGTLHDADLTRYSFLENFFSDLGRSHDFRGAVSPTRWIFSAAVTVVGLSMMGFFYVVPRLFRDDQRFGKLPQVAAFFGFVAGICYIGVAFTPYDLYMSGHEYSVKIGFSSFFIMSLLLTRLIYGSSYYPNLYGHIFLIFDVILLGYIYLLFFGPDARETLRGLHIQVTGQKIVVYSEIICMLIQMYGARRAVARLRSEGHTV